MTELLTHSLLKKPKRVAFNLGDKRINQRANFMLNKMAKSSQKSLPQIFCTEKDLKGAYRFFNNNLITPDKILEPHSKETVARCKFQSTVLAIQDSSDISFDYMESLEGFEKLHTNIDKGFRIHPILATTEQGTPLGVLNAFNYTRGEEKKSTKNRNALPIEEKESYRWLLGYREACKLAEQAPGAQVISIADSESDIYECLMEGTDVEIPIKADILIRAQHNRCLNEKDIDLNKLEKKLIRCKVVYTAELQLNKYRKNARKATVAIRACTVSLKAPATCQKKSLSPITINVVLVSEIDPKTGIEPIHWLLLTTLPIDSEEEIRRIVRLYATRWSIETYFKVLKSGCKIDEIRFQDPRNIENYIAFSMIVGWKVMLTTYLPREFPDAPASILFTEVEWRLAFARIHEDKPIPESATLKEAVQYIAMLGGYQKRKEPPGIQTVWIGICRVMDLVYGYDLMRKVVVSAADAKNVEI
jgi:hypothetical protein